MKRLLILLLLCTASVSAQTTVVTGTITDPQGNPYQNGTASAQKVVSSGQNPGPPFNTTTNAAGLFTFNGLLALPSPASYIFTICAAPVALGPKANPPPVQQCFANTVPIAISGASQDVSTTLNALAPTLGPQVSNITGNALTATSLQNAPVQCGASSLATGITANGTANCTNSPSVTNLTVSGTQTVGKWNSNCIVDGTANATLAAAVSCAGSSGVIEIAMFAVPALTANVTIPAGVTLRFDGPSGITTTGFTLTINGQIAAPDVQIFFGTGTVTLAAAAVASGVRATWFPGADWCAKESLADASYSGTSGETWVSTATGTSACAAAPTLTSNHVLRFVSGNTFSIGVGWTITGQSNFAIAGLPGKLTTVQFTGTAGLTVDGSSLVNLSFGVKLVDITFSGNASITNTVTLKGVSKSYFDFSARNCTGVAVNMIGSLINTGRIVVSSNEGAFTTQPTGGVILDQFTVPSTVKSNSNDIYYVVEGVAGIGVEIKQGNANIIRGILEGNTGANGRAIQLDATVFNTTIIAVDMEANGLEDILTNASYTFIQGSQCLSTVRVHAGAASVYTWNFGSVDPTSGCLFTTIDSGAAGIIVANPTFAAVEANYALIAHAAANSTGSFVSSNTANRFWTLQDSSDTLVGRATTDTLTNKTLNVPFTNGTGLQIFNTTTSCTTAASVGATCTTAAISLPVTEADTSYRVVCTGKPALTAVPVVIATTNLSATQFTITIAALTAVAASFASYDCVAGHN